MVINVVHESHRMVQVVVGAEECVRCALCVCHSDLTEKCLMTEVTE